MEEVPDARPAPEGLEEVVELAVENVVELVVEEIPNEDVSEVVVCVVELAVEEIPGARPAPEVMGEEVLESDMIEILQHMKIPNKVKYQSNLQFPDRQENNEQALWEWYRVRLYRLCLRTQRRSIDWFGHGTTAFSTY